MATYLLIWNPRNFAWESLPEDVEKFRAKNYLRDSWSVGRYTQPRNGDRFFLLKAGQSRPKGIFASGYIKSSPIPGPHFLHDGKSTNSVKIEFDYIQDGSQSVVIERFELDKSPLNAQHWSPQMSGISILPDIAKKIEKIWNERTKFLYNIELGIETPSEISRYEGKQITISVNSYERDRRLRAACLQFHGNKCSVCNFDFSKSYKGISKTLIHVHHIHPLSIIKLKHKVDPKKDLFPVCPNCHAVIHSKDPAITIEQARLLVK